MSVNNNNNHYHINTICSICLEPLDEGIKLYNCVHLYHDNCINSWNGTCPVCRGQRLPSTLTIINNNSNQTNNNSISEESIYRFKSLNSIVPPEYNYIYHQKWEKNDCVNYNHRLIFLKPYGVLGICEDCKIIQCFNLSHPINS